MAPSHSRFPETPSLGPLSCTTPASLYPTKPDSPSSSPASSNPSPPLPSSQLISPLTYNQSSRYFAFNQFEKKKKKDWLETEAATGERHPEKKKGRFASSFFMYIPSFCFSSFIFGHICIALWITAQFTIERPGPPFDTLPKEDGPVNEVGKEEEEEEEESKDAR
jgi:hypothetical protein